MFFLNKRRKEIIKILYILYRPARQFFSYIYIFLIINGEELQNLVFARRFWPVGQV